MKHFLRILLITITVSSLAFAQDVTLKTGAGYGNSGVNYEDGILYDQTTNPGANGAPSQYFPDFLAAGEAADDFVVPAGETWTIDTVYIVGTYSATGVFDDIDINFFSDAAGLPGALVDSRLGLTSATTGVGPIFTVPLSPAVVLTEGTYWLNFMVNMNFTTNGQFFWSTSAAPTQGNPYAWRDSTGLFGTACSGMAWNYGASVCGVGGGVDPDLQFALYGTSSTGGGGMLPEVLYYIFDETGSTTTTNYAVPGRGSAVADVLGGLTMGSTGQFGAALIGAGGTSSTDYVNTGWATDIGTSDWTISLWLNNLLDVATLRYLWGDNTAGSFRCFYNGVAPTGGIILRGTGIVDVGVTGVQPGPSVVHFVYDSTVPEIRAYLNGVFQLAVPQASLNITGSGPFKVGGYSSSAGMESGGLMDEFRFYDRALDAAEISSTWNISVVPVELTSFTASVGSNNVTLEWETATEINNSGFAIERKSVTSDFAQIGFVAGFGTTTEPKAYTFTDNSLTPGTYSYRLKQIDFDGTFDYSDVIEVEVLTPDVYTLAQNYPNPFNPSTKIAFSLAVDSKVSLKIFDVLGQEVATLVNQNLTAGVYNYDFNATGINSGVYFYKIEAVGINGNEFVDIKKMMLLK